MSAFDNVNNAGVDKVAAKIGLKKGRMNSWGPCPACSEKKRGKGDNRMAVGVTPNGGGWHCHICKTSGSTVDLISVHLCGIRYRECSETNKSIVLNWLIDKGYGDDKNPKVQSFASLSGKKKKSTASAKNISSVFRWEDGIVKKYKDTLHSDKGGKVMHYLLNVRCFDKEVIKEAELGCMIQHKTDTVVYWLVIPLKDKYGKIVNLRFRTVPPTPKTFRVCPSRPMPLYGAHTLSSKDDFVVVTEGELDVLALNSYGYQNNVVSGTTGAATNWKEEWLNILEPYKGFYLWYDSDAAGEDGAKKLAEKLGKYRCFRVKSKEKDVGEILQAQKPAEYVSRVFDQVEEYVENNLNKADSYSAEIEQLIKNPHVLRGISTGSHKLDTVLGGIRPGLWVVTGDTGHGKTTWVTWLLWEQALRNTPVMVTSFEQRPIGTVQKLLRAQIGGDFTKINEAERQKALIELGDLPMYILDHYGELSSDKIIETIRFAKRRYGIKIAMVDHLGFLTGTEQNENERIVIQNIVRKMATISVIEGITIILVCHPNNMSIAQQRRVMISDLKGASSIRQDAHVALVIQRQEMSAERGFPAATVWVDKVRSEFGLNNSHCTMAFDPISCVYADTWDETPSSKKGVKIIIPT